MPRSPSRIQAACSLALMSSARTPLIETMRPRIIGTRVSVAPGRAVLERVAREDQTPAREAAAVTLRERAA